MKGLMAFALISALLLFGCISPTAPTTGAALSAPYFFTTLSNNSSGTSAYVPYALLAQHTLQVNYNGNWSDFYANVSLQGTIDNSHWTTLGSVTGNTTSLSFIADKPVVAVRLMVTGWNASTNASIANLTSSYLGSA